MFKNFFNKNKNKKEETEETINTVNNEEKNSNIDTDNSKKEGAFLSFVLLEESVFDFEKFKSELSKKWGIESGDNTSENDNYIFNVDGIIVALSLTDAPVPNGEAEHDASKNWMWQEAVSVTEKHKAHLVVAVLGEGSTRAKSILFVKLLEVCCGFEKVLGIYVNGTVHMPALYKDLANTMDRDNEDALPIFNLVWIGLWKSEKGANVYTTGLNAFGKDEMEILDSSADANTLHETMTDLVAYVLESDVTLRDGETIGFSAEQKWTITRSESASDIGMSLKIGYN